MLTLTTADARRQFSSLIGRVHLTKQRAILTRYGQPLVALVPLEDFHVLGGAVGVPAPAPGPTARRPRRRRA